MAISDSTKYPDRYKLLFENSFEAMVIFDRDGNILEVNQHMADMVGYFIDEMMGMNVFDFMLPARLIGSARWNHYRWKSSLCICIGGKFRNSYWTKYI